MAATQLFNASGQEVNGNGNGTNGMPWQVRAIGFFGVPSAIAIFLVWNMTGTQASDIRDAKAQLAAHASASAEHAKSDTENGRHLERLLRQICVNTSKAAQDRANCFQ